MKLIALLTLLLTISLTLSGAGLDQKQGEFVLGFYSADAPTEKNFQLIRDAGINYVHTYATGDDTPQTLERARRFLDLAQKYRLKVMFNLGGRKWVKPEHGEVPMLKMVDQLKNHPALGMWYLYDEPEIKQIPRVEQLHAAMKKATPDIPCSLVIHWIKDWDKARTACDILMVDLYPVRNQEFPQSKLSNYTDYLSRAVRLQNPSKPVIGVIQSMNWDCFAHQLKNGKDAKYRFPNLTEMRYMGFSSIALGVRGLFFYSFYHIHTEPSHSADHKVAKANLDWYQQTFMPFLREVKDFAALVSPAWEVTALDHQLNSANKVYAACWNRPNGKYLVLTNGTGETRNLVIDLKSRSGFPRSGQLIPWSFTRTDNARLKQGVLSVTAAAPWETFIWQVR